MKKESIGLTVVKTKHKDTKLSSLVAAFQWFLKEYGDCNVYTEECGYLSSDFFLVYSEDVFGFNCENKEEMYHSGLFVNAAFEAQEEAS